MDFVVPPPVDNAISAHSLHIICLTYWRVYNALMIYFVHHLFDHVRKGNKDVLINRWQIVNTGIQNKRVIPFHILLNYKFL